MEVRVCRICKVELAIGEFGVSSAHKDGLQTACRPCNAQRTKDSKKRKQNGESLLGKNGRSDEKRLLILNAQLEKQKVAVQYRTMQIETESVNVIETLLETFEVRRWQDCTKSDVGIRPRDCQTDRWYALQLKASSGDVVNQFRMRGKDGEIPN